MAALFVGVSITFPVLSYTILYLVNINLLPSRMTKDVS